MQYRKLAPRPLSLLCLVLLITCAASTVAWAGVPFAKVEIDDTLVTWNSRIAADSYRLLVSGPGGVFDAEFKDQPSLSIFGNSDDLLTDGTYSFELWARDAEGVRLQWGYLTVIDGRFVHKSSVIDDGGIDDGGGSGGGTIDPPDDPPPPPPPTVPFTVESSAPDHSLYVKSTGNIGFGTMTPLKNLHVVSSSVPTLRLEYLVTGTTQSKWDVFGDNTAFVVSDVTGTATEPFSIGAGAPSDSMVIDAAGEVGLGTDTPDAELHVVGAVRISDTDDDTGAPAELLDLRSDSDNGARIRFDDGDAWNAGGGYGDTFIISEAGDPVEFEIDTSGNLDISGTFTANAMLFGGNNWQITINSNTNNLLIKETGDTANEFKLKDNGDVIIGGTLTELSDVNAKENFASIDPQQILVLATELPLTTWSYKEDEDHARHLGPMAQDFHAAFGLGGSGQGIAPRNLAAVTLAALQGLNEVVEGMANENAELRQQNAELLKRLEALESAIQQGAAER